MTPATCAFLQLILCYTAVSSYKVELYPKRPLFRVGDCRELVCRMKGCSGTITFSWGSVEDRPLYAEPHTNLSESTLVFKNVQGNSENTIVCTATCQGKKMQSSVKIKVYSFPNDPVVSGHDSLVSGQENTLTCTVSDIYPAERITVEWLREGKVIHTQEGELGNQSLQSYYTFKPQPNHTEELITCRATLSLDGLPQEERIRETSVSLAVLSYPLEVSLQPDLSFIPVKQGSSMMLSCTSSGCPHARITWQNVTHQPHLSKIDTQTFMSQLGPWTVGLEDNRTFICKVECGSLVKSKRTELRVFSFSSDPTIEISGPLLEGKLTNLTCTVHDVLPVNSFYIQWLYGDVELQLVRGNFSDKLQNLSLTIPIKPKDSDQNKTFTCKVSLKMEGVFTQKTSSTTLAVHYSPKHTTIDVRPQENLNEGENVTISCQTNSVPEGHVTLSRVVNEEETEIVSSNGTQTLFSIPFINVSHSGIYVCEAVNRYGSQREIVQITVQAPPVNVSLTSKGVQEGETATVCCPFTSFPPSDITLTKLDNGTDIFSNGTLLLVNITANDSGLNQVNTTNVLGSNVISKKKDGNLYTAVLKRLQSIDFIMPVTGMGAVAIVISTLNYIRRAKRKGFYELTEGIP
ncbi:Vascular cell adhesion protein 1 [Bagarius yarrelli]|uniref:Vascular cell adhesion protein 1 n=1 Tax=Bagarius yarrelli TaxID=175774 RepID=A0A556TSB8_BAGYA|nr:Vascular cell adhesion protein 1 [Bagarius yarrelli]